MALFSKFSAGELTGKELKSQWAELSLLKDRPKPGEDREWEAVDTHTDEVLGTVTDYSRTNATNYFRDTLGNAYSFQVREKEPEIVSARAKLAKRIKTPKEKDSESDSEQLQARISADAANVRRRWEFYRAETGAVIDTVDDINMMQANAVRDDIVRRYGHPDESVRMRSVPTEQSAERIRARATLGEPRPAFGDVADVEPDVAQNFPAGTQRNIGGSLAWELYNRDTGETVRTFWQPNEAEASRTAQEYVRDLSVPGSYSIRPQMAINESRDLRESAMMGKIESTGKIVRIIRKQHSVKFSDQKDWLLIDTDPAKGNQGAGLKWLPASTRFEWVRPYRDTVDEDYGPNDPPPGPETKPTMPAGTVRVDVSDVYDWYKLGKNIANLDRAKASEFGQGPPSTIVSFGSEEAEHKYINALKKLGLDTTDIDPVDPDQPAGMPRQKVDPTYNVGENFADGKGPGRPGDSVRHGIPKGATMAELEKASHAKGRKGQLARWQINMRRGKAKK